MKFLIYGINYAPEIIGIGKYSGEMSEWFAQQGHEIRIVCAPPYYPQWEVLPRYNSFTYKQEIINGVSLFRCPLYVPKTPKTLSRLLHLFSFALSSFPIVLGQWYWKPDVVITIEPTFFCTPASLILSKLCKAKNILHIQDFELDAMLDLNMGKQGILATIAHKLESIIMNRFSMISSISINMLKRAEIKMDQPAKLILFPNWVDIHFVTPDANPSIFRQKWNISTSTKVVLYSGNLGRKQGLEMVLKAAKTFITQTDIVFILVGDGAAAIGLKEQAKELKLQNTCFFSFQTYEDLPQLMALADIHLVVQKKGVADAVLPSKLTTILASGGTALITAEEGTELHRLCSETPNIAYCVEPENTADFIGQLNVLLSSIDVNNRSYNKIARRYAEQFLDKDVILKRFIFDIEKKTS